jgi:heme exporter protein A
MLSLTAVAVDIGRTPVLEAVDLEVGAGGVLGVTGPNGSGKTTLLHVCATLLPIRAGRGRVLGADLTAPVGPGVRRRICLVDHRPALYPQLSLRENLSFVAGLFDRTSDDVDRALVTVGLSRVAERRLAHCSQGMARRADLARVLLVEPQLLLLDEAHSGLDAEALALVGHLVRAVRDRGGAAVVVSHDSQRLRVLVDRTLCLAAGRPLVAHET